MEHQNELESLKQQIEILLKQLDVYKQKELRIKEQQKKKPELKLKIFTFDMLNADFAKKTQFNKYENKEKFNIVGKEFEAKGTIIKTIDIDNTTMNISLRCDLLNHKDISEQREEIIDEVLNNEQNNNIK